LVQWGSGLSDFVVEAAGLSKFYGDHIAVDGVSLEVARGSIYGVLGPNGAGKTTTLRMLLGIIDPDGGTRSLLGNPRPASVRARVGYLPEERGLYPGMKAPEAIAFMGALRGLDWNEGRRRGETMMEELGLARATKLRIRNLSKGMAQMVQLIGSIVHAPELVVLDEPFSGLDPVNQERLEALVRRERARGATILFSTHVMAHAERLCDRLAIIARAQRRFEGSVDEARALLPMQVRFTPGPGADSAAVAAILPAGSERVHDEWRFTIGEGDVEPLLVRLTSSGLGVAGLAIARPGLHDAFVHIVRQADANYRDEDDIADDEGESL
jgi:ABC-2 type transport system ATP-binding protein